ncbi:MAG: 30S ribosomal protein S2 [Methanomicrobia archaeon]|nr:30S ribosomal protein S2 [Methanomicrobia archaeon]
MKKLLEAGVHFGHQTRKWNPKMARFIYGARNGIYIIDLAKSASAISEAYKALFDIVSQNGKVLFVGTKKQCQEAVTEEALRSGSFYITNRWLGGTLTNFKTIESRIRYLKSLEAKETDGAFERLPKKEVALLRKEKDKLTFTLSGIKEMRRLPQAVIVVDPEIEQAARNLGAGEWTIYRRVTLPLLKDAFANSFIKVFSSTMTALGVIIFLLMPRNKVIVQVLFQSMTGGLNLGVPAVLALMLSLVTLGLMLLFQLMIYGKDAWARLRRLGQ